MSHRLGKIERSSKASTVPKGHFANLQQALWKRQFGEARALGKGTHTYDSHGSRESQRSCQATATLEGVVADLRHCVIKAQIRHRFGDDKLALGVFAVHMAYHPHARRHRTDDFVQQVASLEIAPRLGLTANHRKSLVGILRVGQPSGQIRIIRHRVEHDCRAEVQSFQEVVGAVLRRFKFPMA